MKDALGPRELSIAQSAVRLYGSPVLIFSETQKTGWSDILYSDRRFTRSSDCTCWGQKKLGCQVRNGFFWALLPINFQINRY